MFDVTQFAAQDFMRVFTKQAAKGLQQYGKPLTTETPIDPAEYAKEELVDAFVYVCRLQADAERMREALRDIAHSALHDDGTRPETPHEIYEQAICGLAGQPGDLPTDIAVALQSVALPESDEARYRRALESIVMDYDNMYNAEGSMYATAMQALGRPLG